MKDGKEVAAIWLIGCVAVIALVALLTLTLTPLLLWLGWNVCVVGVLAPVFGWTLPTLGYWQLVAAGVALGVIGSFFNKIPQIKTSSD